LKHLLKCRSEGQVIKLTFRIIDEETSKITHADKLWDREIREEITATNNVTNAPWHSGDVNGRMMTPYLGFFFTWTGGGSKKCGFLDLFAMRPDGNIADETRCGVFFVMAQENPSFEKMYAKTYKKLNPDPPSWPFMVGHIWPTRTASFMRKPTDGNNRVLPAALAAPIDIVLSLGLELASYGASRLLKGK
jgi:hypothetical protein